MKKAIWLLLLATLFACGPAATESQPVDVDAEEETAVVEEESIDEAESEVETEESAPAATDLGDFAPASSVEEAAVVRAQDWQIGATDPLVVIIEYGDFQ